MVKSILGFDPKLGINVSFDIILVLPYQRFSALSGIGAGDIAKTLGALGGLQNLGDLSAVTQTLNGLQISGITGSKVYKPRVWFRNLVQGNVPQILQNIAIVQKAFLCSTVSAGSA